MAGNTVALGLPSSDLAQGPRVLIAFGVRGYLLPEEPGQVHIGLYQISGRFACAAQRFLLQIGPGCCRAGTLGRINNPSYVGCQPPAALCWCALHLLDRQNVAMLLTQQIEYTGRHTK